MPGKMTLEKLPSGKVRYAKHDGKRWKSKTFHADTRDNRRVAWAAFLLWRDEQQGSDAALARVIDNHSAEMEVAISEIEQMTSKLVEARANLGLLTAAANNADNPAALKEIAQEQEQTKPQLIRYWIDEYITHKSKQANVGDRSSKTIKSLEQHLENWAKFVGDRNSLAVIDNDSWKAFYFHLAENESLSPDTRKQSRNGPRTFLKWAARQEGCELVLPTNLDDPDLNFSAVSNKPKQNIIWTADELDVALETLPDHWQAWLLLMLNCGFTQTDLNALKHSEIQSGRIIRRREKTKRNPNPPLVNYPLWECTQEALAKVLSEDETYALLTARGSRLTPAETIKVTETEYKTKTHDNVSRGWGQQRKKFDELTRKPVKGLRKSGSTTIKQHPQLGWVRDLYLGHSTSIADRNYDAQDGRIYQPLDEAVAFVAEQFGRS